MIKTPMDSWTRGASRSTAKRRPAGGGEGFGPTSFTPDAARREVTAAALLKEKPLALACHESKDLSDVIKLPGLGGSKYLIHVADSPDAKDTFPMPQAVRRSPRLAQAMAAARADSSGINGIIDMETSGLLNNSFVSERATTPADKRVASLRKKKLDSPAAGHNDAAAMGDADVDDDMSSFSDFSGLMHSPPANVSTAMSYTNGDCPYTLVKNMAGLTLAASQEDNQEHDRQHVQEQESRNDDSRDNESRDDDSRNNESRNDESHDGDYHEGIDAVPASSFDLREAAAGGDGDADDCERRAIFEEMLYDASEKFLGGCIGTTKMAASGRQKGGRGGGKKVLSAVEKEAMEMAAAFVVEQEGTKAAKTVATVTKDAVDARDSSRDGCNNVSVDRGSSTAAAVSRTSSARRGYTAATDASRRGGGVPWDSLKSTAVSANAPIVARRQPVSVGIGAPEPEVAPKTAYGGKHGIMARGSPSRLQAQKPQQLQQAGGARRQQEQKPRASSTGRKLLTMPQMPNFRTTQRAERYKPVETTEQAEIRKQREMQKELKQITRRNQLGLERNRRSRFIGNVHSSKLLTVPEGPAMKTSGRLGEKTYAVVGPHATEGTSLRTGDHLIEKADAAAGPKGPTVPEPFRLSQSNRLLPSRVGIENKSKQEPSTLRDTRPKAWTESKGPTVPEPFRLSQSNRPNKADTENKAAEGSTSKAAHRLGGRERDKVYAASPTVPEPFRLSQSNRPGRMTISPKPREETFTFRESLARIENKTPDRFRTKPAGDHAKARPSSPFNPRPTQPRSPRLRTEARAAVHPRPNVLTLEEREEAELAEMKRHQFKARSYSAGSIGVGREGAVFKPRHSDKPLTQQAPFRLSTDARATKRFPRTMNSPYRSRDEEEMSKPFKARPMPSPKRQSVGVGPGHKSVAMTEARPFHLRSEERGRAKQALLAQRLLAQQKQDEAARRVRARPLPAPSKGFVNQRRERPLTEPKEFRLSSQARHEHAEEEFQERVSREEEQARRAFEVHALPLPVAPEPYPQRTEVPLTQPVEMTLHSAARAEERGRWDMENQARLDAAERQRRQEGETIAAEEQRAIAELRRRPFEEGGMAFKAKPITRTFAPPEGIHVSTAPLTTPITPNLRTTRRAMVAAPR